MTVYESVCGPLEAACAELAAGLRETRPGLFTRFEPWRNAAFPFWATFEVASSQEAMFEDRGVLAEFELFTLPDGRWRWSHDLVWVYGPGLVDDDVWVDQPAGADREAWLAGQVAGAVRFLERHAALIGAALDSAGPGQPDADAVSAPVPWGSGPTLRDTDAALRLAALGPVEAACAGLAARLRQTRPGLSTRFTHRASGAYLFNARLEVARDEAARQRGEFWLAAFTLLALPAEPIRWGVHTGRAADPAAAEVWVDQPPGADLIEWVSDRAAQAARLLESHTAAAELALDSTPPD